MNEGGKPPRQPGRINSLFFALLALPIVVLLLWWAGGLRAWNPSSKGFGERPIHISLAEARLEDALAVIHPGVALHFSDPDLADLRITLEFPAELRPVPEAELLTIITQFTETTIVLDARGMQVEGIPLLERSYRWISNWTRGHGGWSLWPNR